MNTKTKGSTTVAFVMGAVAGGVTALLLAPQSGVQLRRRLKNGADELHTARERLNDKLKKAAREQTAAVTGAVAEAKNTYKDELERRRHLDGPDSIARKTGA